MSLTVHLRNFILKSNQSVNSLPFFLINMEWQQLCVGLTAPHCHDRRLCILFHFSPTKCSQKPSNDDSYVFTKKRLPWPSPARDSGSLLLYIFHKLTRPLHELSCLYVPKANCQFLRTRSSTHFCKTEFSVSWEKDFSLTVSHPKQGMTAQAWWNCHKWLRNSGQKLSSLSIQFWLCPQSLTNCNLF